MNKHPCMQNKCVYIEVKMKQRIDGILNAWKDAYKQLLLGAENPCQLGDLAKEAWEQQLRIHRSTPVCVLKAALLVPSVLEGSAGANAVEGRPTWESLMLALRQGAAAHCRSYNNITLPAFQTVIEQLTRAAVTQQRRCRAYRTWTVRLACLLLVLSCMALIWPSAAVLFMLLPALVLGPGLGLLVLLEMDESHALKRTWISPPPVPTTVQLKDTVLQSDVLQFLEGRLQRLVHHHAVKPGMSSKLKAVLGRIEHHQAQQTRREQATVQETLLLAAQLHALLERRESEVMDDEASQLYARLKGNELAMAKEVEGVEDVSTGGGIRPFSRHLSFGANGSAVPAGPFQRHSSDRQRHSSGRQQGSAVSYSIEPQADKRNLLVKRGSAPSLLIVKPQADRHDPDGTITSGASVLLLSHQSDPFGSPSHQRRMLAAAGLDSTGAPATDHKDTGRMDMPLRTALTSSGRQTGALKKLASNNHEACLSPAGPVSGPAVVSDSTSQQDGKQTTSSPSPYNGGTPVSPTAQASSADGKGSPAASKAAQVPVSLPKHVMSRRAKKAAEQAKAAAAQEGRRILGWKYAGGFKEKSRAGRLFNRPGIPDLFFQENLPPVESTELSQTGIRKADDDDEDDDDELDGKQLSFNNPDGQSMHGATMIKMINNLPQTHQTELVAGNNQPQASQEIEHLPRTSLADAHITTGPLHSSSASSEATSVKGSFEKLRKMLKLSDWVANINKKRAQDVAAGMPSSTPIGQQAGIPAQVQSEPASLIGTTGCDSPAHNDMQQQAPDLIRGCTGSIISQKALNIQKIDHAVSSQEDMDDEQSGQVSCFGGLFGRHHSHKH